MKPTLHLNGTGFKMLYDSYEAAYRAIGDAKIALKNIEFHSRDYYVQADDKAWTKARDERTEQFRQLDKVEKEMLDILIDLQHQQDERSLNYMKD
jgi:hypothetical protein